ncbi:MAG: deoxyhypusine synthase [Phycisphaerae bacterium]
MKNTCPKRHLYGKVGHYGKRIDTAAITKKDSVSELIKKLQVYNGGRLSEACELLEKKYSQADVTVGMTLAGAMTPGGLGAKAVIPLMEHGFVDWLVATGANMYHDLHFALDMGLFKTSPNVDDRILRNKRLTRIYDICLHYDDTLMKTDYMLREILMFPEFQKEMGTQEFYYRLGRIVNDIEKIKVGKKVSVLAAAYRLGIPVFTSSPGDSTIGMNIAGLELCGEMFFPGKFKLKINTSLDVNESTAIVLDAKKSGGKSAMLIIGGGSPKNFGLQTEPQIQEILQISEVGQDYFTQITTDRPDVGGLSGATPSEAVSWGKIDPDHIDDTVVVYMDASIALPFMTSYILQTTPPKKLKRLYTRKDELYEKLKKAYAENNKEIPRLKKLAKKL